MPSTCVVYGCVNRGKIEGITYHGFPTDKERRPHWINAIKRKDWEPNKYSKICSAHFRETDIDRTSLCRVRIRDEAVPTIFKAFPKESQGVPKLVRIKPPHNHPPNNSAIEISSVRHEIRTRFMLNPSLRPADILRDVMASCSPEVRASLARHAASIKKDLRKLRSARGNVLRTPVNRTKTHESEENKDTSHCDQKEFVKDEIVIEEYRNLGTYFESERKEAATTDIDVHHSPSRDVKYPLETETVICDGGLQIKQEIFEDEMYGIESAHELKSVYSRLETYDNVSDKTNCAINTCATSPVSAPDHMPSPPEDEGGSCTSGSQDLENVLISLKNVPVERRNKTKDKLLRLVQLISLGDVDPDEVRFSITTK